MGESIPFHLSLHSTPTSLATYLPMSPMAKTLGSKKPTQVQLMRQSTVDVKWVPRSEASGDTEGNIDAFTETWKLQGSSEETCGSSTALARVQSHYKLVSFPHSLSHHLGN